MKLHLPKGLFVAVMAVLALNVSSTLGAVDTVSINFGDPGQGGVFDKDADGDVDGVTAPFWNHVEGGGQSDVNGTHTLKGSTLKGAGDNQSVLVYENALTLQTNKDPWGKDGIASLDTVLGGMQSSYLDADANAQTWTVTLNFDETDYAISGIKLYFSGDSATTAPYSAINFNGISYVGGADANKQSSETWGDRKQETAATIGEHNTLIVNEYINSSVVIKDTAGTGRDTLSGMQISLREVYRASLVAGANIAESITWAGPDGFSGSYTDITPVAERFLRADVSAGDATLTFASGAEIDTLHAKGGHSLTIDSAGQLNIANLEASAGTTISVGDIQLGGESLRLSGLGTVSLNNLTYSGTITSQGVTNITGGLLSNLTSYGTTSVSGGEVTNLTNNGTTSVSGGEVTTLTSNGTANITGGEVMTLTSNGTANITGGKVTNLTSYGTTSITKDATVSALTIAGGTLKWGKDGGTLASVEVTANSELFVEDMIGVESTKKGTPLELTSLNIAQGATLTVNNSSAWKYWAEVGTLSGSGNLTVNGGKYGQDAKYISSFTVGSLAEFAGNLSFTSHEANNHKLFNVTINTGKQDVSFGGLTFAGFGQQGETSTAIFNVTSNTTVKTLSAAGSTVTISAGKGLTIGTSSGSANSSIGILQMADGSKLTYFNRSDNRTSDIANLNVTGNAEISTLRDPNCYHGTINIGSLTNTGNSTSLTFSNGSKLDHVTLFNINGGSFNGTLKLVGNSDADKVTNRRMALNLNDGMVAQNTIIEFADTTTADDDNCSDPANNYISVGLGVGTVKIAGLNGTTTNAATIWGHQLKADVEAFERAAEDTSTEVRTLELTGTGSYSTNAKIEAGINILKSGSGTQIFSGDTSAFDGSVTVKSGVLGFTGTGDLGEGGITVDTGAELQLGNANGSAERNIGNVISGGGSLTVTGAGTLTLSGANTYTGGTTIKKGILALSGNGTLGTGLVTIEKDGTLKTNGSTATMSVTGAGAIDLGSSTTLNAELDSNWTGTVKMSGATLADADLNAYGNANSTVQLNSSTGSLMAGDINTKVELKGAPAFKVTKTTGKTITFNNAVSGDANFVVEATGEGANTGTDTYVFKGDVSSWKDAKGQVGFIAASDTNVKYEGDATTINHGIYANAGTLNATIGGEKAVTVNGDITNEKWPDSAGTLNLTVANSSAEGVTFTNTVKANTTTIAADSKATFTGATADLGTLKLAAGASVTTSGALTLGNISLDLTDYAAGSYTLVSATNGGSISWEKGSWTHNGTLGSDLVANVGFVGGDNKTLTLTIAKAETTVPTVVIEEKNGEFWYTLNELGTSLTLNVEEGSLAGLVEGGLVELKLISERMKQDILQNTGRTGDDVAVTLYLSDGTRTIEAGKDAIVGFYNEDNEGYWGKLVGNSREYELGRIPEPTTGALSLIGLAALAMRRRRK